VKGVLAVEKSVLTADCRIRALRFAPCHELRGFKEKGKTEIVKYGQKGLDFWVKERLKNLSREGAKSQRKDKK